MKKVEDILILLIGRRICVTSLNLSRMCINKVSCISYRYQVDI